MVTVGPSSQQFHCHGHLHLAVKPVIQRSWFLLGLQAFQTFSKLSQLSLLIHVDTLVLAKALVAKQDPEPMEQPIIMEYQCRREPKVVIKLTSGEKGVLFCTAETQNWSGKREIQLKSESSRRGS